MLTISKRYDRFPFSHRQHTHGGHCRFIHGHNWSFQFVFAARDLDENGFVVDFGSLGWLKDWLNDNFDHTLCLSADDPAAAYFEPSSRNRPSSVVLESGFDSPLDLGEEIRLAVSGLVKLRILPAVSAEGIAKYVFGEVSAELCGRTNGRARLVSVTVFEDEVNSATYVG